MKRILIIQTAFIGDVILATSLVETLHQAWDGDVLIDLVVRKGNEQLVTNHPKINQLFVWNKKEHKYRHLFQLIGDLRQNQYDVVYNLQRFATTGFMTWRIKAKLKVGYAKNPFAFAFHRKSQHVLDGNKHEIERNFELVKADLPENSLLLKPKLYPSAEDYALVESKVDFSKPVLVLAPASVWFTKQLPRHKWVELINLLDPSAIVYLIGAPSDVDLIQGIIADSGSSRAVNLAGQLSLLQSAALIDKAARSYVNDSAPLHLASAMNAPVTAFFCSTVPAFGFGPLSDDAVLAEIDTPLACRPCGLHGFKACPKGHFKCGEAIKLTSIV